MNFLRRDVAQVFRKGGRVTSDLLLFIRRKNMLGIGAMDRKPESLSGFPGINQ